VRARLERICIAVHRWSARGLARENGRYRARGHIGRLTSLEGMSTVGALVRFPFGERKSGNTESRDPRVNEPSRELYLSAFFVYPYGVKGFATTTAIAAAISFRKSEISTPVQTQGFGSGC
jgi:hypothetical protein